MTPPNSGTPCPDCGTTLRLDIERALFYCDGCHKYITASESEPAQAAPQSTPATPARQDPARQVARPVRRKQTSFVSSLFIFLGLSSFVFGTLQAIQAGQVETVFQQIVWANIGTQTMLGLLLVALGVMIRRLDVLVAENQRPPTARGPGR